MHSPTAEWVPFVVLLVIIVVPHLITVIVQLDIWPYSHYPMYAYKKRLDDVGWFHVWLEKPDGTRRRWIPSHIRFAREVNRAFTKLMRAPPGGTESSQHLDLLLGIVERRVRDDHPSIADFDAFCELSIVYVTCPNIRAGDLQLREEVRHRRSLSGRSGEPAGELARRGSA
jgi:hypothetical protein